MHRRELLLTGAALLASPALSRTPQKTARRTVLVWSEGTAPRDVYPDDIRGAVAAALANLPRNYDIRTVTLADPDQGVSQADLDRADVLFWWGHQRHGDISDTTVQRIVQRVKDGGMGFVALHSSHFAKPFQALLGATGAWKDYVDDGKPERVRVVQPKHPLVRGVRDFVLPREERYDEPFETPPPDAAPLEATYDGDGTSARQLLCWSVGAGRVVYFRPGHEAYPTYRMPEVRRILRNAALWCARDEPGLWEDADPFAGDARASGEPPLALLLRSAGLSAVDATAAGEIDAHLLVRAGIGPVRVSVLAAFAKGKSGFAGWTQNGKRINLLRLDGANLRKTRPTLTRGSKTAFNPGAAPFGLWAGSTAHPGEPVLTDQDGPRRAHLYAAGETSVVCAFEIDAAGGAQDIVLLVENVRPA